MPGEVVQGVAWSVPASGVAQLFSTYEADGGAVVDTVLDVVGIVLTKGAGDSDVGDVLNVGPSGYRPRGDARKSAGLLVPFLPPEGAVVRSDDLPRNGGDAGGHR